MPDAMALLDEAWAGLVAGSPPVGGRPALDLTAPVAEAGLPSRFPVAATAVACVGAALAAAASLVESRDGRRPALELDPRAVGAAVVSERHFRVGGRAAGVGFATLSRFWPTADGWIRTHANYPWHRQALLTVLGVPADVAAADISAIGAAMRAYPAVDLEDRIVRAGGVAAAVRTAREWAAHGQGRAVGAEPLIGHRSVAGGSPRRPASGGRPAEGVRVVDLTRVIAGPVCTRDLGALGADVLRIDPPDRPDGTPGAMSDPLLGKRSTGIDLAEAGGRARLRELLDRADVVVSGYRPGSLGRFGLDPDDLAAAHPGLVIVSLDAVGHTGPWAGRRGFDSIVQGAVGIAVGEAAGSGEPGVLPCQLLDHGTGYLAAAAVLDGLRRQSIEGGTHIRTVSLARTAHWLVGSGTDAAPDPLDHATPDADPWIVELGRSGGPAAVAPPGVIDGRPLRWPGPPAAYLADRPEWSGAPH